jgi:phosphoglycolate phosphatase
MPARYELIVFDWDGTLLDSTAAIVAAIVAACRDLDQVPPSIDAARSVIGLGLEDAIARAVPQLPPSRYEELAARYRHHYLARDHELTLFSGAEELVARLHGESYLLAVATGKSRRGLDRALGYSGLQAYFHATRCADESFSKPHPGMLLDLMEALGVAPDHTLMIGDTTHDLQMAQNAGTDAVAVAFGAHPAAELATSTPRAILHSMAELDRWLRANG